MQLLHNFCWKCCLIVHSNSACRYTPWPGFATVHTDSRRPERGSLGLWCYWRPPRYPASAATLPWQHLHATQLGSRLPSRCSPHWGTRWFLESVSESISNSIKQKELHAWVYAPVLPRSSGVCRTELWSFWSSWRCVCEWECVWSVCSAVSVAGEGVWEREPPRECMGDALSEPGQRKTQYTWQGGEKYISKTTNAH